MRIALLSLLVLVVGCGPEEKGEAPVATTRQAVVNLSQPASLSTWDWKTPLVPRGASSAYLVAVQDPSSAKYFVAWGYDAQTGAALFFVRGETTTHLNQLIAEFSREAAAGMAFDPAFSWGSALQINKRPDPPPPGGGDWRGWSRYAAIKSAELHRTANTFGN